MNLKLNKLTPIKTSWRHYLKALSGFHVIMLWPYSKQWDDALNKLIDDGVPFVNIDDYYADIGTNRVWISNHPYASFTIFGYPNRVRASRVTQARAEEWLNYCIINNK